MKTIINTNILRGIIFSILILTLFGFHNFQKTNKLVKNIPDRKNHTTDKEITISDISYLINFLASDSLKGRKCGTQDERKVGEYIYNRFHDLGLSSFSENYYQPFSFIGERDYYNSALRFKNFNGIYNQDFLSLLPIDSSKVSGEVIFVGYGYKYDRNGQKVDNYTGLNLQRKWAMMFEGDIYNRQKSKSKQNIMERYKIALQKGAIGLLSINIDSASKGQLVAQSYFFGSDKFTTPHLRISQKTSDSIFKYVGLSATTILDSIEKGSTNINFKIPLNIQSSLNSRKDSVHSRNVVAYIEGNDPKLKNEFIIIGAHYDHLGVKIIQTFRGDSLLIYHGADDNASGSAGLLELAEKLTLSDNNLKRSIIFVAFGSEESGLKGSAFLSDNLPVSCEKIKLMINIDMIGRMDSFNNLYVNTVILDVSRNNTLKKMNLSHPNIHLVFNPSKKRDSDFFPFYLKSIPVVSFTTGKHKQYHTINDTSDLINLEGEKKILDFIYDLIITSANRTTNPE